MDAACMLEKNKGERKTFSFAYFHESRGKKIRGKKDYVT